MSLSGQYLEELSRRYKKQVEEMQRSLERAVTAMNEESRRSDEREAKRAEEIVALKEEIAALSKSVETLLYDRDSRTYTIVQHTLLICLEIVVIFFVIFYCCRSGEDYEEEEEKEEEKLRVGSTKDGVVARRKSAEGFASSRAMAVRKTKKRRPSEIVAHINGTYRELMIDERSYETKKERKKKRKKENATAPVSEGRSGTGADTKQVPHKSTLNTAPAEICKRPDYAPLETVVVDRLDDHTKKKKKKTTEEPSSASKDTAVSETESSPVLGCRHDEATTNDSESSDLPSAITDELHERSTIDARQRDIDASRNGGSFRAGGILKKGAKLASPSFIKTALSTRNNRNNRLSASSCSTEKWEGDSNGDRSTPSSPTPRLNARTPIGDNTNGSVAATNGLIEESDESRSSSATPTLDKKEKKSTGLKKMVRKFF